MELTRKTTYLMHASSIVVKIDFDMKLSIITTLFSSSPYLEAFFKSASFVARDFAEEDYEIIFVNDESPDNSLMVAIELAKEDSRIKIIDLSRNFGHHKTMMTGLAHASGDHIFLIDCDLEEDVGWLSKFKKIMIDEDADVVFGVQRNRKGNFFEKITGFIYYKILSAFTIISQPPNITTARLMTKRYVDALMLHQERELNIGGLWSITGFKQVSTEVRKLSTSQSTYTFRKKLSELVNAITSFSSKPLLYIFYIGVGVTITAIIFIAYLLFIYFFNTPPDGYTSIVASIWLLSGIIISMQGILGIYISKIFSEVKQRPLTIIKETINFESIKKK